MAVRHLTLRAGRGQMWTSHLPPSADLPRLPHLQHGLNNILDGEVHPFEGSGVADAMREMIPTHSVRDGAFRPFTPSSQHSETLATARKLDARFVTSTSAVTHILAHIARAWQNFPLINLNWTPNYAKDADIITRTIGGTISRPASNFLRPISLSPATPRRGGFGESVESREEEKSAYALDGQPALSGDNSLLSTCGLTCEAMVGETDLEKLRYDLTLGVDAYQSPDVYQYQRVGPDMVFRSQLDSNSGVGVVDIKARGTRNLRVPLEDLIVVDPRYRLSRGFGPGTFEEEQYDLIRNAFTKYALQSRIGNMAGVFCCYHNGVEFQGFQYISQETMDTAIWGSPAAADCAFEVGTKVLREALVRIGEILPGKLVRIVSAADPQTGQVEILFHAVPAEDPYFSPPFGRYRSEDHAQQMVGETVYSLSYGMRSSINGTPTPRYEGFEICEGDLLEVEVEETLTSSDDTPALKLLYDKWLQYALEPVTRMFERQRMMQYTDILRF